MQPKHGIISADYKAEGGKLLRVQLHVVGDPGRPPGIAPTIRWIKITGDFFMHPEEAIEQLEAMLTDVPYTEEAVRTKVQAFFDPPSGVQVIGAGVDDFVHVMMAAGGTRSS
jgi:hypothetical protein